MPDTAQAIARDLVEEVGWLPAVTYMLRRVWREVTLLAAVVVR